ncbi:MAG: hypothetical protein ACPGAF_05275, partial [Pseudohongiellaceae bacterium]
RISNRAMSDINISPGNLIAVGFLLAETVSCRLSRHADCPATRVCVKLTARSSDDLATLAACQEEVRPTCLRIDLSISHSQLHNHKKQ